MGLTEQRSLLSGNESRLPLVDRIGYRFCVLAAVSLICFGQYFTFDSIQNFENQLGSEFGQDPKTFHARFLALYSIYSIPNFVLPFFGGLLGDKIGLRLAASFYVLLVVLGSVVSALGPSLVVRGAVSGMNGYWVMFAGRFIFGCGAESLNAIQTSMISLWFKKTAYLAFAMSLTVSVSRLGDFLTLGVADTIANAFGTYHSVLWIGAALCGLSMVATFVYAALDRYAENRSTTREPPSPDNPLQFRAVLRFDARFWVVAMLCMTYYSGVFPFVAICSTWLTDSNGYNISSSMAGWYSSIITLTSMILSPFLGGVLDKIKRRPYAIVVGSLLIVSAHCVLFFNQSVLHNWSPWLPLGPIIVVGLSFSIVPSALWPCIPLLIPDAETATAFGTMASIQNMGLAFTSYLAGNIADNSGYSGVFMFFLAMDVLGLIFGVILIVMDQNRGGLLIGWKNLTDVNEPLMNPINENAYNKPYQTTAGQPY